MSTATLPKIPVLPGIQTPIPVPSWFRLSRHDNPDPSTDPEPTDPEGDPAPDDPGTDPDDDPEGDPDPEGDDPDDPDDDPSLEGLGEAGRQALARMKAERAEAKKQAAQAKLAAAAERRKAAQLAKKVQEFEDRDKSELDRAKSAAERAQDQATKAVARSVKSEIRLSAAGQFEDIDDATDVLMRDPAKYVDDDGEVDTDLIQADLAALLERKPHWGVKTPADGPETEPGNEPKKQAGKPKPDPGQGSRGPAPRKDFRTASREDVAAELSRLGIRNW